MLAEEEKKGNLGKRDLKNWEITGFVDSALQAIFRQYKKNIINLDNINIWKKRE